MTGTTIEPPLDNGSPTPSGRGLAPLSLLIEGAAAAVVAAFLASGSVPVVGVVALTLWFYLDACLCC